MFSIFKNKHTSSLYNSFPKSMQKEIKNVLTKMPDSKYKKYNQHDNKMKYEKYKLMDEFISIPKRYYSEDIEMDEFNKFNDIQKQICCCVFLLNHNGFIREKYLKVILKFPTQDWMLPFLMNISADYVKEILQVFYDDFRYEDKSLYIRFCNANKRQIYICYSRMVSYWDCYYRLDTARPCIIDGRQGLKPYIKDYVGHKLFRECFGFSPRRKDLSNYDRDKR